MINETDDNEVDFQELDQAIEVSVGDLIVVGNNIFRCTSLMVNHNEPPTVIFDSIVHEMKKPASDTVRDKIDEGLLTPSELMARVLGGLFPYPNKE